MKQFKLLLNGIGLICVVFALLSFTSLVPNPKPNKISVSSDPEFPNGQNYTSFTTKQKRITQRHRELTPLSLQSHPNFGDIYPGINPDGVELLQLRKSNERVFDHVDKSISTQTILGSDAYFDEDKKWWVTPHYLLSPESNYWSAKQQKFPSSLYEDGSVGKNLTKTDVVRYNLNVHYNGVPMNISDKSVGDHGMYITNGWNNVDRRITLTADKVEDDYIIKSKPSSTVGEYSIFQSKMLLPAGYFVELIDNVIYINDASGKNLATYSTPLVFDSNTDPRVMKIIAPLEAIYEVSQVGANVNITIKIPTVMWE